MAGGSIWRKIITDPTAKKRRALRILFVNYEFPPVGGGGGTGCKYLARELVRMGHEVEVVTSRFKNLPKETRSRGLLIRRIPVLRKKAGQSNPIEMMSYVFSAAPYLFFRGGAKPDVAVSFHTIPSGLAAWPLSLMKGVPHVTLFRGGDVPGWMTGSLQLYHRVTLPLNRAIVRTSAAALANSNGLRDLALKSFPWKDIGVLHNGVETRVFAPPPEGRANRTGPVRLLFVGRVTPQKGIDLLLEALSNDALKALDWRLDLIGAGPQLAEYRQYAADRGIGERVICHGWLGRPEVRRMYRDADVLVHPSRSEGMPNVVLEAMASALPVIGTRIAGTEQLVKHEGTGLLIESDDLPALESALARMITNKEDRLQMGAAGRKFVQKEWSWTASAKKLEGVMLEAVGEE